MAWKTVKGHRYWYESRREGGRVVSAYCGGGPVAELASRIAALDAERKALDAEARRAEREVAAADERDVAEYFSSVEAELRAALTAAGYHQHRRGEWRRRRG